MDILEAMQQRHSVRQYEDRKIEPAKVSGFGFYSGMDLGIVKYHFEAASGKRVG